MINKVKNLVMAFVLGAIMVAVPQPAFAATADELENACQGNNSALCASYRDGKNDSTTDNAILKLLKNITNILAYLAGVLAVIFVMWGGFKYITSGGDASKAASGRQTLTYALIGVIVIVISRQLIIFVLNRLT
jgi:Type IV secretion system pilin